MLARQEFQAFYKQQRTGAGNRASGHGSSPGHHGRAGQVAAHGSSIAALQSSLTTGLSNKADQSRQRGPEAVELQHHGSHERLHRLGQQRHAGHGGRQLRPQDGGGPALPRIRIIPIGIILIPRSNSKNSKNSNWNYST